MSGTQRSLTGEEAERVECEYYDGCRGDAVHIAEILHYGEGEKPVRMCDSCADEHAETEGVEFGDDIQRLKPEDRYVGDDEADGDTVWIVVTSYPDDPHPHIEDTFTDEEDARDLMDDCRATVGGPNPVAWCLYRAVPGEELELIDP